ncbi:glycosyltransferase family 2 protein [Chelativorans salis]|uniref:Glycosyltransferase n=1 Tax=Chelativorans salis TaxID=2978478 RepID=A0ABT2LI50_9HYPH|nr:glycosyltransferase [Chelativorans sp. EGI FJ00035]MCT7373974.1 glycosyltransferase [Chelativorans sp. EGI FJ00035]
MTAGPIPPTLRSSTEAFAPEAAYPATTDGPTPLASFIVCTRNRVSSLDVCIASIQAACQSHAAITAELVMIDNGSTDGTSEYLARIDATSNIAVTIISEPRPGLAAARNAGLKSARGRIFVFIDDDCEIHRDYLRDLERHYASGDSCVIRGGRVELGDSEDLPFTIKRSPVRARLTREVHPGGFVLGCNMTMHREVAALVGDFDERFGAGGPLRSAEDTDYLVRAYLLGIPVEYVPDMTVFHHHGRNARQAIETLHRNYSLGNGGLCLKHIRDAPWLLLHFYWTVRSAFRELMGGPRFDSELRLSHWSIVSMNMLGAAKFVGLLIAGRPGRAEVRQVQQATAEVR